MKITGIHVDGYGTLADLDLDGLAPTLSIVYGLNEAGKSTLLDFIRAVLFGFPTRRSRQNFREPRRGGRHGGALRLLDEDGRPWRLERYADAHDPVLTDPDGRRGGDAELRALLGGANAGLFRSIFAFGLDELTSLETLDDNDVRDLVFTAGVLGAGRSATRAMRELEERRAEIVRQRSPDARANQLRRRLDDLDARLRATRAASEGYASAQAEHRRLCAETEAAQRRLEELHRRETEIDHLRTCWPLWNRIHESAAKLADLGPPGAADGQLVERAPEIRLLSEERSAHTVRLGSLGQHRIELAGIERARRELVERQTHLEQSPERAPAGDGETRSDAELRTAEQAVQLLRGLISQRDQLLAGQREREAMARLTRQQAPGGVRPRAAIALLATAFVATLVVAGVEFSWHHPALGAVCVLAGLALSVAAGLVAAGSRQGATTPRPGEDVTDLAAVDPQRLSSEIARAASALGLATAPALVEVEAVARRLEAERDDRHRADELVQAQREIVGKLGELREAHERLTRAIDTEMATVDTFEESVRRSAVACGFETDENAAELCGRLTAALGEAETAVEARRGLLATIDQANSDLAAAVGLGPRADELREELAAGDLAAWDAEDQAIKEQLAEAERGFQQARDAERDMAQALEVLRSSDEIAALEVERASLATQLEDALERWAVLGLGHALLEATFARYEREKQPAVIARASELFNDVTAGRYVQLVAHEDDRAARHGIDVISARDERVDSGSLSRGTAEQLYLCLRLGLAATHAERTVSLPFVLDDVLVNFDPGRAAAVAQAIAHLARSHQVLAFTCHPHIVDVFRQTEPDCALLELPLADATGPRPGS